MSFVVTCAQCQKQVLEGDRIGDEEKCVLSDRLLAVHAQTVQPETPPPVASVRPQRRLSRAQGRRVGRAGRAAQNAPNGAQSMMRFERR